MLKFKNANEFWKYFSFRLQQSAGLKICADQIETSTPPPPPFPLPFPGKPRTFDYLLCPGSGEFDLAFDYLLFPGGVGI